MIIRPETPADYEAITQLTVAAFTSESYSPTEHLIILGLRQAGVLSLSLVADLDGRVVGYVAFSAVKVNGQHVEWYGLGPISVQPELQKQGVGSKLIQEGLSRIRALGAKGCVVLGSPKYYQRIGFKAHPSLTYEDAPAPEYFMAIIFHDEKPNGSVEYHKAFYGSPATE